MYIGLDIGGTNTRIAVVSKSKRVLKKIVFDTRDSVDFLDEIMDRTEKFLDSYSKTRKRENIKSAGIGFPSIFDKNGTVYETPNIKSWKKVPLRKSFEKKLKIRTYLDNDANCFAWGEKLVGNLKGSKNSIAIILGTGVGAGIIIDDKIHSGLFGAAGEFGKVNLFDGSVEDFCSGKFFEREYNVFGEDAYQKAKKGKDKKAKEMFSVLGKNIAYSLLPLIYILSPEKIILGGSIGKDFDLYSPSLLKVLKMNLFYKKLSNNINVSYTENMDSSLIGAAFLHKSREC